MFLKSAQDFKPFTLMHLLLIGLIFLAVDFIIKWGLRQKRVSRLVRIEKGIAALKLFLWGMYYAWQLHPTHFHLARSLPLHLCDLVAFIVPLSFLWRKRFWVTLIYFWGLGFSLQGILTPDLQGELTSPFFWLFWLHHGVIVGAALYWVIVHRFRPTWQDYWIAVAASITYLAIVLPINFVLGANYGYLGNLRPLQPSLIDLLGPWPLRVISIVALSWGMMTLLQLLWTWRNDHHCRSS